MSSCRLSVLAAASLAALCAVGVEAASAGSRVEVVPSPVLGPNELIVNVADYGYDRWRYGPRYTRPWGRYNNYYRGYYYGSQWWQQPSQSTVIIITPSNPAPAPIYPPYNPVYAAPVVSPYGQAGYDNTYVNNNTYVNENVDVNVNVNSNHVAWCEGRYYSYDPRTDTFMGNDGYRHLCRSPY